MILRILNNINFPLHSLVINRVYSAPPCQLTSILPTSPPRRRRRRNPPRWIRRSTLLPRRSQRTIYRTRQTEELMVSPRRRLTIFRLISRPTRGSTVLLLYDATEATIEETQRSPRATRSAATVTRFARLKVSATARHAHQRTIALSTGLPLPVLLTTGAGRFSSNTLPITTHRPSTYPSISFTGS